MKNRIKEFLIAIALFGVSTLPSVVYALERLPCDPTKGIICNPLGSNISTIPGFIQAILTGAIEIGIPVVSLAIIYSGFLFVFARGNSEKLNKAKDTLLYTLIGAAILLGSWAIAQLIQNTIIGLGTP